MGLWLGGDQKEKVLGGVSGPITRLPPLWKSPCGPMTWVRLDCAPFCCSAFCFLFLWIPLLSHVGNKFCSDPPNV